MFCPACGNEIVVTAVICPKCGSRTGQAEPHVSTPYNYRHPANLIAMGLVWMLVFWLAGIAILTILTGIFMTPAPGEEYNVGYQMGARWGALIWFISITISVWGTLSGKLFGTQYPCKTSKTGGVTP